MAGISGWKLRDEPKESLISSFAATAPVGTIFTCRPAVVSIQPVTRQLRRRCTMCIKMEGMSSDLPSN